MARELKYEFGWLESPNVPENLLIESSDLFSNHYGIWGPGGPRPGEPVTLSAKRLRPYLDGSNGRIAFARYNGELVCYATAVFIEVVGRGRVAWVTQLVTHENHRQKRVASRVLSAIWGFSDYYAWGLVTANPFAVKALQNATTRRCVPSVIEPEAEDLLSAGDSVVPYVADKHLDSNYARSVIDTGFHVSHSDLPMMIEKAREGHEWRLGELHEGQEWFAFTFKSQPVDEHLSRRYVRTQLADSDELLSRVYEGMSLDEKHVWTKHDTYEAEFVERELGLSLDMPILDLGCGQGRLSIKLGEKGFSVTGIDFVAPWIAAALKRAESLGVKSVKFLQRDARTYRTKQRYAAAICVYDVIGSYADDFENYRVIESLFHNLTSGAKALISVMNMSKTERQAKHWARVEENTVALLDLPPSRLMQDSGEVFNPDFYLIDEDTKIVYRKEQFDLEGHHLPAELIVRDRRYHSKEIEEMCLRAGFEVEWTRHVRAGHWDADLGEQSDQAKEILVLLRKP